MSLHITSHGQAEQTVHNEEISGRKNGDQQLRASAKLQCTTLPLPDMGFEFRGVCGRGSRSSACRNLSESEPCLGMTQREAQESRGIYFAVNEGVRKDGQSTIIKPSVDGGQKSLVATSDGCTDRGTGPYVVRSKPERMSGKEEEVGTVTNFHTPHGEQT